MNDLPAAHKTVLLGVCGGIAAYKAVDLASRLKKLGAEVHVIMTAAATKLVAPLTFQAISGQPVHVDLLSPPQLASVEHIALARRADLFMIAPATADVLAKLAAGIADDFLTTEALAVRCPVLVCPAMNYDMWAHPAVLANAERLSGFGYHVMEPAVGPMAEGGVGRGRLPEPPEIVEEALRLLGDRALAGRTVLVTAGATREPIDPVRFLSNRSSGKMGYAIARAALRRGARAILVSGPSALSAPAGAELVRVETAAEMLAAVLARYGEVDAVVKAAAVADYRPAEAHAHKIKKEAAGDALVLRLERNPDVLAELGAKKTRQVLVGFAAETEDALAHARRKLEAKNLDMIVVNDVTAPGSGFESDTNRVWICHRDGRVEDLPLQSKDRVADEVIERVARQLAALAGR